MFDHPDRSKREQSLALEQEVAEFLNRGGKMVTLGYCIGPDDLSKPRDDKPSKRLKFTRKDDLSIGYKPVERPSLKLEMTIMSTPQKKGAVSAAKPKTGAAAAAPKASAVPREPLIDVHSLVAQSGIARPVNQQVSRSVWIPVLLKLEPDQSYFIPNKKRGDLGYVKKTAEKNGIDISLYDVHEKNEAGEVISGVRIFRNGDDPKPTDDGLGDE